MSQQFFRSVFSHQVTVQSQLSCHQSRSPMKQKLANDDSPLREGRTKTMQTNGSDPSTNVALVRRAAGQTERETRERAERRREDRGGERAPSAAAAAGGDRRKRRQQQLAAAAAAEDAYWGRGACCRTMELSSGTQPQPLDLNLPPIPCFTKSFHTR